MTRFDCVIVGAGPAGRVLANRLAADPGLSVLMVEAGDADTNPLIAMPRGLGERLATRRPRGTTRPARSGAT